MFEIKMTANVVGCCDSIYARGLPVESGSLMHVRGWVAKTTMLKPEDENWSQWYPESEIEDFYMPPTSILCIRRM